MSDYDDLLSIVGMDEAEAARMRRAVSPSALFADVAAGMRLGEAVSPFFRTLAPDVATADVGRSGPTYAEKRIALLRRSIAASLVGGMIAASGRPHTAAEAVAVLDDVMATLHPPEPEADT